MTVEYIFSESIRSKRTFTLFLLLTIITLILFGFRWMFAGMDGLSIVFLCLFLFFLFSSINYTTLNITLDGKGLTLKFGIFSWNILLENIAPCQVDHLPWIMEYGGAGIHFMVIRGRYRASINFLEYTRVVISLIKKVGPVRDISFSTKQPETLIKAISDLTAKNSLAGEK